MFEQIEMENIMIGSVLKWAVGLVVGLVFGWMGILILFYFIFYYGLVYFTS